jgi:hypothetical protein
MLRRNPRRSAKLPSRFNDGDDLDGDDLDGAYVDDDDTGARPLCWARR